MYVSSVCTSEIAKTMMQEQNTPEYWKIKKLIVSRKSSVIKRKVESNFGKTQI